MGELIESPFQVEGVIRTGRYLGTPVLVVKDCEDGMWLIVLWPDKLNPGRSHGKDKPFTYRKGEWRRVWHSQVHESDHDYEVPEFPLTLEPKPEASDV